MPKRVRLFLWYKSTNGSGEAKLTQSLEEIIHQTLIERGLTLSLAESCTGGSVSSRITKLPGCSQYFLGSVIAYCNEMKIRILGVDQEILLNSGAVSREVVELMANGVMQLIGSDYSVAISGIAGPSGGTTEKPVGTIWAAICKKNYPIYTWSFQLKGNRQEIINQSAEIVLQKLLYFLKNESNVS